MEQIWGVVIGFEDGWYLLGVEDAHPSLRSTPLLERAKGFGDWYSADPAVASARHRCIADSILLEDSDRCVLLTHRYTTKTTTLTCDAFLLCCLSLRYLVPRRWLFEIHITLKPARYLKQFWPSGPEFILVHTFSPRGCLVTASSPPS